MTLEATAAVEPLNELVFKKGMLGGEIYRCSAPLYYGGILENELGENVPFTDLHEACPRRKSCEKRTNKTELEREWDWKDAREVLNRIYGPEKCPSSAVDMKQTYAATMMVLKGEKHCKQIKMLVI
ncbi:hypothetical protein CRENBAI_008720 [Crenichthys baileyi]|uniref:Uncharacterized protein n=1 Tax=Crenichthys baileyi TaxID=28760 RepID=A0AAV9RMS7_9TELE